MILVKLAMLKEDFNFPFPLHIPFPALNEKKRNIPFLLRFCLRGAIYFFAHQDPEIRRAGGYIKKIFSALRATV